MSDSLMNLPVQNTAVASQDYAKIQPYIASPASAPASKPPSNKFKLKTFAIICIIFAVLSLPLFNTLFKLNSYITLAIKVAIFAVSLFFIMKFT
jgi:hypothetical protein